MNGVRRVEEKLDEGFDVLLNKKKKEAKNEFDVVSDGFEGFLPQNGDIAVTSAAKQIDESEFGRVENAEAFLESEKSAEEANEEEGAKEGIERMERKLR